MYRLFLSSLNKYLQSIHTVLGIINNLRQFKAYRNMCVHYLQVLQHFKSETLAPQILLSVVWLSWNQSPVSKEGQLY
jgi:hypothetical protein